jgi:crotonobetainyl-CoA:carnitine CoA-transferase CaiB-like acyl-CoA transferase
LNPLDGIVVLDLTRLLPGAVATQLLGDFGAEIIKIEQPPKGDPGRVFPPLTRGQSALFALTNKGKKSVSINLKDERGKAVFLRLAERADVLVESFRPGVMPRLGLGYNELARANPGLIYAAITGYGQSGAHAFLPGHDINYLGFSGLLDLTRGIDGAPQIPPVPIADLVGGSMPAVMGILLAIVSRLQTGRGQIVDASMVDGMMPLLTVRVAAMQAQETSPTADAIHGAYACYNIYKARNNTWLAVGALEPHFWSGLCAALQCQEFIEDQFAAVERQKEVMAKLSAIFLEKEAEEWFALLGHVCVSPIRSAPLQFDVTPKLSATPGQRGDRAPRMGENTREILRTIGLDETELANLETSGVIQSWRSA